MILDPFMGSGTTGVACMKVVLVHGVWDLLHTGHLAHLEAARRMGTYLLVSIVPDKYITKRKPIYSENERIALLEALRCVNRVVLCDGPGPEKVIKREKPDLYVRGSDYRWKRMPEYRALKRLRIPTRYTRSVPPRTSEIIERIKNQ